MIIMVLFFILLITIFFIIFGKKKIGISHILIFLLIFFSVGSGLFPMLLLSHLQNHFLNNPKLYWERNNAIVLLGAGAIKIPLINNNEIQPAVLAYSRIYTAARLYFSCVKTGNKCTIIISGGDPRHQGASEAAVYQKFLLDLQVKDSDIVLESNSMNTFQNAKFTRNILQKYNFDQVLLVTSGTHLKRSLLYFAYFKIFPKPYASDYLIPKFSIIPSGYNFILADLAMHEYGGMLRFYIFNLMNWNQ